MIQFESNNGQNGLVNPSLRIIFIGSDTQTVEMATLSLRLRWPDAALAVATTATEGLKLAEQTSPDVVLIYPDFADMALTQVIRELRSFSSVPLLVLGREGGEQELVACLAVGADDYMRQPCGMAEMMVRVWAVLRRVSTHYGNEDPIISGRLFINTGTYEAFLDGERITLTSTEFQLLHLLVKNRGIVVTHYTLERALWGDQVNGYSSGLAKKYIQRLRGKLKDDSQDPHWIASVHGVGYRFVGPRADEQALLEAAAA